MNPNGLYPVPAELNDVIMSRYTEIVRVVGFRGFLARVDFKDRSCIYLMYAYVDLGKNNETNYRSYGILEANYLRADIIYNQIVRENNSPQV